MIVDPETTQFKVNVKLKDGNLFSNHDIPSIPISDHERIFSFWVGNKIRTYPINDIEYFELIPQEEKK